MFNVDVVVFDKDGLLFEARHFWIELANVRAEKIRSLLGEEGVTEFYNVFGIKVRNGSILDVDPNGVFAVASPQEEMTIAAALFYKLTKMGWDQCRKVVYDLYKEADSSLDLTQALKPKEGFPEIFKKLRQHSISYGIATSDDHDRTRESIEIFDSWEDLSFVITPADVEYGKPHPEMLNLVSMKMEVPISKIMMIGDSFVDVKMAKDAGAVAVGIPEYPKMNEKMKPYADVIISSLNNIEIL